MRIVSKLALASGLIAAAVTLGAPPSWWTASSVTNGNAPSDFAAANIGQVKTIAAKAIAQMNATFLGGAGPTLNNLLATWQAQAAQGITRTDYAVINQGQLKTLAKLFYDRLYQLGYQGQPLPAGQQYPWPAPSASTKDFAAATIGQVKTLFSFNILTSGMAGFLDANGNGIDDNWELHYYGNLTTCTATSSHNLDGLTDLDEFRLGLDPTKNNLSNPAGGSIYTTYTYNLRNEITQSAPPVGGTLNFNPDAEGNLQ